jgi:hypothetical protein
VPLPGWRTGTTGPPRHADFSGDQGIGLRLIGALAAAAASTDQPVAAHEMSAIDFVENAARLRAAHYREEAIVSGRWPR